MAEGKALAPFHRIRAGAASLCLLGLVGAAGAGGVQPASPWPRCATVAACAHPLPQTPAGRVLGAVLERDRGAADRDAANHVHSLRLALAERHSFIAAAAAAPDISWTELGPDNIGGRVNAILIDPSNAQRILLGTAGGGLWGSTDGGVHWSSTDDFLGSLAVGALARAPNGDLFAGTGDLFNTPARGAGIFISTDDAQTWSALGATDPSANRDWFYVHRIAINANGVMLVATGVPGAMPTWGAIYRSTDNGQTFSKVQSGASLDVAFDPNDDSKAVAEFENGTVRYSTDGGQTWSAPVMLVSGGGRITLSFAQDSSHVGWVFASVDNSPSSAPSGQIWRSKDDGKTWARLSSPGQLCDGSECQGAYDNVLAVDPTDAGNMITGGINLFASQDGGSTWQQISDWRNTPTSPHADQHAIAVVPGFDDTTNPVVYFGTDGGVYKAANIFNVSTTSGWTELDNGLAVTQFYSAAGHVDAVASANGNIVPIVGGTQDNGTEIRNADTTNTNWSIFFGGDGGFTAVDSGNANFIYGEYVYLDLFQSTNGGVSALEFANEPPDANDANTANFIAPFLLDPASTTAMFAGGQQLWLGTSLKSGGVSWRSLSGSTLPENSGDFINAVGVDQGNSSDVWVGFDGGALYHSTNAKAGTPTWQQVATGSAGLFPTSIYVVPGAPDTVYVSYWAWSSGNISMTSDGGASWQTLGQSLPPIPVNDVTTDPRDSRIVYAATEIGLFVSADGGQTWTTSNAGPANVAITQLRWFDLRTPRLLASTYGRGMFMGRPANLSPVLNAISPSSAEAGSAAVTLDVQGGKFATDATVQWNGAALKTTFVSVTELKATIPSSDLASAGTADVTVMNPAPGGGTSGAATFTVNDPVPALSSISPSNAAVGSSSLTITLTGSGFVPASVAEWEGSPLTTTYVSDTQLTATVPDSDLSSAGTFDVTVVNPAPGGGTSGAVSFTVGGNNPTPTLSTLSPAGATAGSAAVTLTLTGTGFITASVVDWNGSALSTAYVSDTQLTATIPSANLATGGMFDVTVANPAPGGGTSGAVVFVVNNMVPTLTGISPSSVTAGSGSTTITLTGTGFVTTSTVRFDGNALATTYLSATQLKAVIPASRITTMGTFDVTVMNPTPGGGTSGARPFTVTAGGGVGGGGGGSLGYPGLVGLGLLWLFRRRRMQLHGG